MHFFPTETSLLFHSGVYLYMPDGLIPYANIFIGFGIECTQWTATRKAHALIM